MLEGELERHDECRLVEDERRLKHQMSIFSAYRHTWISSSYSYNRLSLHLPLSYPSFSLIFFNATYPTASSGLTTTSCTLTFFNSLERSRPAIPVPPGGSSMYGFSLVNDDAWSNISGAAVEYKKSKLTVPRTSSTVVVSGRITIQGMLAT